MTRIYIILGKQSQQQQAKQKCQQRVIECIYRTSSSLNLLFHILFLSLKTHHRKRTKLRDNNSINMLAKTIF